MEIKSENFLRVKIFAEFIFANRQFLFIFAEFIFVDLGKIFSYINNCI